MSRRTAGQQDRDTAQARIRRRVESLGKEAKRGTSGAVLRELARVDVALEEALAPLRVAADTGDRAAAHRWLETINKLATRWQVLAYSAGLLKDTVARRRNRKEEEIDELRRRFYGDDDDEA